MTVNELGNKMQNLVNNPELFSDVVFIGVKSVQSQMVERIFENGKNSDNGKIGDYDSSNEIYVADKSSPKAGNHKGKPNKEGKSKTIKTTYYKSYADFRSKQRQSSYVDLKLFGRLQSDFANAPIVQGNSVNIAVSTESANKVEGNENKYGKIFRPTKNEMNVLGKVITFELKKKIMEEL